MVKLRETVTLKVKILVFEMRYLLALFFTKTKHKVTCRKKQRRHQSLTNLLRNLIHANNVLWYVPAKFKPHSEGSFTASFEFLQSYEEYRELSKTSDCLRTQVFDYSTANENASLQYALDCCASIPELVFILMGPSWDTLPKFRDLKSDIQNFKVKNPNSSLVGIYTDTALRRDLYHLFRLHTYLDLVIVNDQDIQDIFPCMPRISPSVTPISKKSSLMYSEKASLNNNIPDWDIGIFGTPYPDRLKIYHELTKNGFRVYMPGSLGIRLNELDYIQKQSISKIQICTTLTYDGKRRQMKGHIGESLNVGSCTLVDDSSAISRIFTEGKHYLKFNDTDELVRLCRLLLDDDEVREKVSSEGQEKYRSIGYSANYWLWVQSILVGV
jgi:hypothetical protein